MTQRRESARMWSDHQCLGGNGPCRREKGGSPAFLKSCVCAPPLKRPVGDQLQLRNARATWPARPAVRARHPRRGRCAVARHAKHVGSRGRHASAWTARDGQPFRRTLNKKSDREQRTASAVESARSPGPRGLEKTVRSTCSRPSAPHGVAFDSVESV